MALELAMALVLPDFSHTDVDTGLFMPDGGPMTDQGAHSTQIQLGEPVSLQVFSQEHRRLQSSFILKRTNPSTAGDSA